VPPAPTARVNDYAGLLASGERARLEQRLADGERATGVQVVVAIFSALDGESLEDVSIRLAERWRIGQKGLDNGAILLVFVRDRKLRLEVGYGLEPTIPDAVAGRIVRDVIAPRFREGHHAAGLESGVEEIYARIGGPGAPARAPARAPSRSTGLGLLFIFVVLASLIGGAVLTARRVSRRLYTLGPDGWYVPPIPPPWSGGGGWRGGSWGSGGGFGGGGGAFGGGGASGDW
jgi:uncharacterized protein